MNYPTNTPLYKVVLDAMSRESAGTEFVIIGCDPSATGTGLQVALAVGATVSQQVGRAPAGTTLTMTAAHATLDRRDIVYETGGAFAKTDGTPASPAIPPALPAGAVLIAIVKVAANQTVLAASDVIDARQVRGGSPAMPNLVLNSDFGRRTVFGLAMPEVLADTSAWTGGAPSVAGNALTQATASVWTKWTGPNSMWRDGRWSAQYKAVSATGRFMLAKYVDENDAHTTGNAVFVECDGTNFLLRKAIAGTETVVASVAQTMVLNNRYWLELEAQGTTYIAKMYSSGAAATTKATATLVQTLTGTIADAGVVSGGVALWSNQPNSVWGEQSTGNGGVYVETWLPESWAVANVGTLGGWAIGFDESADAGPVGKQWAVRTYIPATDRRFQLTLNTPDGSLAPSVAYTFSMYMKSSGATGTLIGANAFLTNSALTSQQSGLVTDLQSASWARQTVTLSGAAGVRRAQIVIDINGAAGAKTGTAYFMLPQLEQGSAATAWRNAPADDGPITWSLVRQQLSDFTTASISTVEVDHRDLSANIFLPWDAIIRVEGNASWANSVAGNSNYLGALVDGATMTQFSDVAVFEQMPTTGFQAVSFALAKGYTAGRRRVSMQTQTSAGTLTIRNDGAGRSLRVIITATRGR